MYDLRVEDIHRQLWDRRVPWDGEGRFDSRLYSGLDDAIFALCLHGIFPLEMSLWQIYSFYKDTGRLELGPILMISFQLYYLYKEPIPK